MVKVFKNSCLFLLLLITGCSHLNNQNTDKPWTHIELAAGNYGKDGHTKISQHKTVLKEFTYVSKAKNYIDDLPEVNEKPYVPEHQHAVTFSTLDQLVAKKGPRGIFHVNDLYAEYAIDATEKLKAYAQKKKYKKVIIEAIPGNYLTIDPEKTLKPYHLHFYDSVHLKNPEVSFFNYGMDGNIFLYNEASIQKGRAKLQTLANLSCDGLYFFPIDWKNYFIPKEEEELMKREGFYSTTKEWEPVPYYFPEGPIMGTEYGKVFFIKSNNPGCPA
jgi:hypothetical protein